MEKRDGLSVSVHQLLSSVLAFTVPLVGYLGASGINDLKTRIDIIQTRQRENEGRIAECSIENAVSKANIEAVRGIVQERSSRIADLERSLTQSLEKIAKMEERELYISRATKRNN